MRKTKIICTIGPACSDEKTLTAMVKAGMNVARLNFSHGTHESHKKMIDMIKKVRDEMDVPLGIMLDTKGPEYRIRTLRDGKATLMDGDLFALTTEDIVGDNTRVSVSYKGTVKELSVGDVVTICNGLVILRVEELTDTDAICRVENGGEISDNKSMSFPGKVLNQEYLSEQDKSDLLFGIENDVDLIACSFVSSREDIEKVRAFMLANGGEEIDLIAKIENRSGVDNIEDIIAASDGIMVARGDLGVEIPYEELPAIQKKLINTCRLCGKRVITATEMLESMTNNPRPTRAEISDVANAVYDGTSALMLSGETAAGKYPVEAVTAMSKVAKRTEDEIDYTQRFRDIRFNIQNTSDAISHATCALAIDVDAKLIVACTLSGSTARMVSRFRAPKPIVALTTSRKAYNKLALSWAVIPMLTDEYHSIDVLFYQAVNALKTTKLAAKGDHIIITAGEMNGKSGSTNLIKLETI
ncbi:MAG: pyruvate kinase [Clostridia bacterium]|nr:pyruvate kinase [Clostridia bacterium]